MQRGGSSGRGAPPPMGPPGWPQPSWAGMPYYPPYMPMLAPSVSGMYSAGEYCEDMNHSSEGFHPPSPLNAPCTEAPKSGQKCHHFETEQEDLRHEAKREKIQPPPYGRSKVAVDRVACQSPSPDIKDVLVEDNNADIEPPVIIKAPQLDGPLAFTQEALKTWGRAHLDQSEQTHHFHTQLKEWKEMKEDLWKILMRAYEEMRVLKEHVMSNDVTQEHLYALHIQVKCTATRVREASHNIDQLIGVALKQMTLNVVSI